MDLNRLEMIDLFIQLYGKVLVSGGCSTAWGIFQNAFRVVNSLSHFYRVRNVGVENRKGGLKFLAYLLTHDFTQVCPMVAHR